jgi:alkanesulfonate monooxygenase SsuD/methylene tetrahydromethanopterin reductase-like flavin-dependent oxidoreductase (luciferase family)
VAERYGRTDPNSPYRFYWNMMLKKMMVSKRHAIFKTHERQDDAELTDDYMVDRLVISGTVDKVVDRILALREEVGDFGELVYAGMDWVDPVLARRSMELMAHEVMPRVNRAIGATASRERR